EPGWAKRWAFARSSPSTSVSTPSSFTSAARANARSSLAGRDGLDVGAVRRDAALDEVEVFQDDLESGNAVAKRRRGVEARAVRADVIEDEVAAQLEDAVEMLHRGDRTRQVLSGSGFCCSSACLKDGLRFCMGRPKRRGAHPGRAKSATTA